MVERARAKIIVSGKVQGVSFRKNTQKFAEDHNLVGYAKNVDDGSVEIIAEGLKKNVERIIEFCTSGPPGAIVYESSVDLSTPTEEFKDFDVL